MARSTAPQQLLIVEDDADQSRVIQDRLKLYGYAVACAVDGRTAIEMLDSGSFDGVLLDLNVPEVHGSEVLRETRQRFPEMPVLIMSASQSGIREAKASQPRACGYLVKPFNAADFKSALQCCFGFAT
jgi:DNA-binding response OmpR family regulator